ncbi:MAG: gamma carbonic anhydrase family protein, partial [Actinobacteria bacterium]|nr:gamma carbonic anhydrase family protein [Actinomycetota bacterium]
MKRAFDGNEPGVADSAWIAPSAMLIGRVTIGSNASVYFGAVLRGDVNSISLGDGSNIQDNVAVHCDH